MPWNVKPYNSQYCVFKEGESTPIKGGCYKSKQEAENRKEALYANTKETYETYKNETIKNDPVIVGVAVTNIPHLPLPQMSVVERNGETMLRVPFLRKGIFRNEKYGTLIFDDSTFDKLLSNHEDKKSWFGVSLNLRHDPDRKGALAWFSKNGGSIVKESDPEYGELLVGYGKPTTDEALDLIKNEQYSFASVEINPNYKPNMIARLSLDELDEIKLEDLYQFDNSEEKMEEVTISQEEYDALKGKEERVVTLEAELADVKTQVANKEAKIVELEAKLAPEQDNLPEEARIALENYKRENHELKRSALKTYVDLVITKAETYRDSDGRGHSPVLLELVKAAMLGGEVKSGDEVIKLESTNTVDVAAYYNKVFVELLNSVPGQVQFQTKTVGDNKVELENDNTQKFTDEDYARFWGESVGVK